MRSDRITETAHKVTGIRAFAFASVRATVIYLFPYSPDFSPIESCWSKIKEFLRIRAARTYAELDQAITDALAGVKHKILLACSPTAIAMFHPIENHCISDHPSTQRLAQALFLSSSKRCAEQSRSVATPG